MRKKTQHRYFVEWSAPNYKHSSSMRGLAYNKTDAITTAKKKLGKRVTTQFLHHFDAFRISILLSQANRR